MRKNRIADAELIANANVSIEPTGYDNWDGGTTIWELRLEVPYPDYLSVEKDHREDIEKFIDDVVSPFLPETGHWVKTTIKPVEFKDPNWRRAVAAKVSPLDKYQTIEPTNDRLAFISYQTVDKHVAGRLQRILQEVGIMSFLAHEDIEVSAEWREKILEELGKASMFISVLSNNYFESPWCVQESGIAAYRGITSLHLSIDGNIPRGFSANIQSIKVDPDNISLTDLLPGIVISDFDLGVELILDIVSRSGSFRSAEANFRLVLPHIPRMSDKQIKELLEKIYSNKQIHHASKCAKDYIPSILESHGHLLSEKKRQFLTDVCEQYA